MKSKEKELLPLLLLVGNPNVGKTTIFNLLSKKYAITANYLFTTIELNSDIIQIEKNKYELIDTPGIYRLDHPSEEGQQARDLLLNKRQKIIVQVIESAKLEQSLLLTYQLVQLQIPMVIVLNMNDELVKHGIRINSKILSEHLGVRVIETIATEGKGTENIKKSILKIQKPENIKSYPYICKNYFSELGQLFPGENKHSNLILTLMALDDSYALKWIKSRYGKDVAQEIQKKHNQFINKNVVNLSISFLNAQQHWIQSTVNHVITRKDELTKYGVQKFGEWSRHPVLGWLVLLGLILSTYFIVGKFGASYLVTTLDKFIFIPVINFLDSIIEFALLERFLIGDYGLLTTGLFNAIGTVLPIITLFFLMLNLMEDTGYLTNLVILTSRVFKKFGLTGKSILPIVLGFGCKTMATLSTKILDTKKEKYIAIFLIGLAIPCSSQMSIILGVLSREPLFAFLIVFFILTSIEIVAGLILNKIIPKEKQTDFIIEIPPVRVPDFKLLMQKTYYRSIWFLKEAVPLFLLGAFILFILNETTAIKLLEAALRPVVVGLLNLPINFSEVLVMSLARSEAGAVLIMNMATNGSLSTSQVIVAIIVTTLFIPCISNVMAIVKELKPKKAVIMILIITTTSIIFGGIVNFLLKIFQIGV
ncbi:ferrous iron transport protein B [candidate division KSB1 bacterium 4572_119]|nr:MAG: ferrous iron transport protein B [candidate division KSB1 bacterium 4572_119]